MNNEETVSALPTAEHSCDYDAGSIKAVKVDNRRSDASYLVDPRKLVVDPNYNVRVRTKTYLDYIRTLADDMKANGYDPAQPVSVIVVKKDGADVMMIRAGNTRREAAILAMEEGADFDAIPVIFRPKTDNDVDQTIDLVKSNSGRPLSTYELAIVVKRLVNKELSESEISRRLGLTTSYVSGLVLLAAVPYKLAMYVIEEKVSAAVAIDLVRKHGNQKALEIVTSSLEKATAAGKSRVTPKHLPDAAYKKALKTKVIDIVQTAELVRQDPAYNQLAMETQDRLNTILNELADIREAASSVSSSDNESEARQ